jgi:hypothetical protein
LVLLLGWQLLALRLSHQLWFYFDHFGLVCNIFVELISCLFITSPNGQADGRPARRLEELKVRLTQPSLAGTGAELGNEMEMRANSVCQVKFIDLQ